MTWDDLIAGNTVAAWTTAMASVAASLVAFYLLKRLFVKRLLNLAGKSKTVWDDFAVWALEKSLLPVICCVSIYAALSGLDLQLKVARGVYVVFLAAVSYFVLRMATGLFRKFVRTFIHHRSQGDKKERQANGLIVITSVAIWILGALFFLDNLGYNITTFIAGLGIGGVAIALAGQTILGDLFSYFVIFFDRPFEIGDFVTVDDKSGTIEYIGIKTTRIRTLSGEQLVFSNSDLTGSRLHNYKLLQERRVQFNLYISYNEDLSLLRAVPDWVTEIITSVRDTRFDRSHLATLSQDGAVYEFVYIVLSPDYNYYMDIQQSILFSILDRLQAAGLTLAYPTRNIRLDAEVMEHLSAGSADHEK